MNKINKKQTISTFITYNENGQVILSPRFLVKGARYYYEYKSSLDHLKIDLVKSISPLTEAATTDSTEICPYL